MELSNKYLSEKRSRSSYQSTPKGNAILDQILFSENAQSNREPNYLSNQIDYNSKESNDALSNVIPRNLPKNWSTDRLPRALGNGSFSCEKPRDIKYSSTQFLTSEKTKRNSNTRTPKHDLGRIDLSQVVKQGNDHFLALSSERKNSDEQWLNYLKLETPQISGRKPIEHEQSYQEKDMTQDLKCEIETLDQEIYEIQQYISQEINNNKNAIVDIESMRIN